MPVNYWSSQMGRLVENLHALFYMLSEKKKVQAFREILISISLGHEEELQDELLDSPNLLEQDPKENPQSD